MACRIRSGSRRDFGFTLIELMIVMAIVVILIGIAVPQYQKSIIRAKESVLHSNLFTLRQMIDEYSFDRQKAPQTLQDLVTDGYLRSIPMDPMTGNNQSWQVIMEIPPLPRIRMSPEFSTCAAARIKRVSMAPDTRTGSRRFLN